MNNLLDNLSNSIVARALPTTLRKLKFKQKFTFTQRLNEAEKIINERLGSAVSV